MYPQVIFISLDVQTIRLQLSPTPVPPKETTYICQGMELPSNDTYHMIASEPLIANENVMHHIVVFKCPNDKSKSYNI